MKKTCVLCFLFLACSYGLLAQTSPVKTEQICFISLGSNYSPVAYQVDVQNPLVLTHFESPVLATLQVPPSRGSIIYFEVWGKIAHQLVNTTEWKGSAGISFRAVSSLIPDNIDVWAGLSILQLDMTNNAFNETKSRLQATRDFKFDMRPDAVGWWAIMYKDTGDLVPGDVAISLQKKLIANGFTVELWFEGDLKGVDDVVLIAPTVEITRTVRR